jgi:peptide chain release factor
MTGAWVQITAGQGPVECAWAVTQVLGTLLSEAAAAGLETTVLEVMEGPAPATAYSVVIAVSGIELEAFIRSWRGTVQWIGQSPYRPEHKRKNWFVGVAVWEPVAETAFDTKDVHWETMRASGPGGQHVNRSESAVRVTHLSTGVQAVAAEERSQHRNRKLALARLATKLSELQRGRHGEAREARWQAHQALERGNPVRVLRAP